MSPRRSSTSSSSSSSSSDDERDHHQKYRRMINCNPGPAAQPREILEQAHRELFDYQNTGISVMEMSHRSAEFENIIKTAEQLLREIVNIPDNYRVLFMHGGGTAQFSAIPLNLCNKFKEQLVNYACTGVWSEKAAKEAEKYCIVHRVLPPKKLDGTLETIPDYSDWNINPEGTYLYYTDNETLTGLEYPIQIQAPISNPKMIVAVDMTSNFLTRKFDVSNYGVVIAAAQKNIGIAGVGVVIIREDLLGSPMPICPLTMDYTLWNKNKSLYNTPSCYPIYMCMLYLQWIKKKGGLEEMERRARKRSELIYSIIDQSNGFFYNPIDPKCRSRINITFRIGGGSKGDDALEKLFIDECKNRNIIGVKGHRLVGGIRISMFNAMRVKDAEIIADLMRKFLKKHGQ
ncbi:hypothetical protein NH340_JMT07014 [Sarcoptes scabiei]|nr:hypothetical protein NH340_JMT07014 [Sarcoptes scabiei]